jgi:hypothetical protein
MTTVRSLADPATQGRHDVHAPRTFQTANRLHPPLVQYGYHPKGLLDRAGKNEFHFTTASLMIVRGTR